MTNPNLTAIGFILDRSGSMGYIADDTIGGFNQFLKTQKESEGEAVVTFAQFDNVYEVVHDYVDINDVPELTSETFQPRGGTALLDAMGNMINDFGNKFKNMEESERPGNVIIVVITDGHENQSREFTKDEIFDNVTHQKETYDWNFIFLGAGQDAIAVGTSYGFNIDSSVSYSSGKISSTMNQLGGKVSRFRSSIKRGCSKSVASNSMSYSANDRDEIS